MAQATARGGGGGRGGGERPSIQSGPSKTIQFRDFSLGLVRAGSRPGIPDTGQWESINIQVIGPGQSRTLVGRAASIATLSGVVSINAVIINLGGVESTRLITIHSDGSARALTVAGAVTVIATAGQLSPLARLTMWRDTHILFADPTTGYNSWDGTTFVHYPATFTASTTNGLTTITWTGGATPASAIIPGMSIAGTGIPAGTSVISVVGTTITLSASATATGSATMTLGTASPTSARDVAVFGGRVWLLTANRGITFTGPSSMNAFETVYAGGATTLTDASFPGKIVKLISALELLWIFGASAIDTLSNVQVSAGVTTFQVENLVSGLGTPWPSSIQPLFRTLVFNTPAGVYAVLGSTPQKLSDALDGLYPFVTGLGSLPGDAPSAVFILNGILCYGSLVNVNGVPKVLTYSRPTWTQADQGADLVSLCSLTEAETGHSEVWGTDGTHIFQLFAGTVGNFQLSTKLFDFGAFTQRYTARRVGLEIELADQAASSPPDVHFFLDSEVDSTETEVPMVGGTDITWINNSGNPLTWINNVAAPASFAASGRQLLHSEARFSGNEIGVTLKSAASPSLILGAIALEIGAAGEWTFAPGS